MILAMVTNVSSTPKGRKTEAKVIELWYFQDFKVMDAKFCYLIHLQRQKAPENAQMRLNNFQCHTIIR
jgi:hypothetical protein